MKKVLLISADTPLQDVYTDSFQTGFVKNGLECDIFRFNNSVVYSHGGLLNKIRKKYELLFFIRGNAYSRYFMQLLKKITGALVVVWLSENVTVSEGAFSANNLIKLYKGVDLLLTSANDQRIFDLLKNAGIRSACLMDGFNNHGNLYPITREEQIYYSSELAFVGRYYEKFGRGAMLRLIASELTNRNYSLKCWGGIANDEMKKFYDSAFLTTIPLYKVCKSTKKIMLTHNNNTGIPGFFTAINYFSMGYGCFNLTNYVIGLENIFENGKHLVWYRTPQEALELAFYYIEHEDERLAIARAGQQEVLDKHTMQHRIKSFIKMIEKL